MKSPTALLWPLLLLATSGCVSTKYKLANAETALPVQTLNISNAAPADGAAAALVEATVHTVIAFQGPGSWKREAYWDEYVVSLANRGTKPVTVESAILTDFQSEAVTPGDNPWALEKQSHAYAARVAASVGDVLKVSGATVLTSTAAGGVAVIGAMNVGSELGAAMVVGGTIMFAAATVVVPVWSIVANVNSRHDVEAEYRRRRLSLPLFLAPGQVVQGSLFFRISPGPRRLAFKTPTTDERHEVTVDLASLAGLHLKTPLPAAMMNAAAH